MSSTDLTGQVLGQYTITSRLGRGGMADVYKAFHPNLQVYRAIKVIRPELVTARDFRGRFQKEAQAVAALRHPSIVHIHDFGEQDYAYYMVMEFIDGQDLKRMIADEGKIRPIEKAVAIISQVADALHYAHARGLVHRDIKPENIMVDADGLPILMDFGIAKLLTNNTQLTQTGMSIGTPAYMAPEQAQALPEIGAPADIYSLAIVLYEMLTGRVPFSADTPMAVMLKSINDPMPMPRDFSSDISEDLQQVLLKGTAKDPQNRYATAKEFRRALQKSLEEPTSATQVMGGQAGVTKPAVAAPTVKRRAQPSDKSKLIAAAAMLLVAVSAGSLFFFFRDDDGNISEPLQPELSVKPAIQRAPLEQLQPQMELDPSTVASDAPADNSAPVQPAVVAVDVQEVAIESSVDETPVFAAEIIEPVPESDDERVTAETPAVAVAYVAPASPEPVVARPAPLVIETIDGGAIQANELVQGQTEQLGQRIAYSFEGKTGERLFFDLTESSGDNRFSFISPDGTELFAAREDHGPVTLEDDGIYTVMVKPSITSTADFVFELNTRQFGQPVAQSRPIGYGTYVQGRTTVPGQDLAYTVNGRGGDTVYFDLHMSSAKIWFSLVTPDGNVQVFKDVKDAGPLLLPQTGTYTLLADTPPDRTAQFEFNLWRVDPPVVNGVEIKSGSVVAGRTQSPGQKIAYTLQAEAGESLRFDRIRVSETTDFALIDPNGAQVFQDTDDYGPVTLAQSGTYSLVADPRDDHTANFQFVVEID